MEALKPLSKRLRSGEPKMVSLASNKGNYV